VPQLYEGPDPTTTFDLDEGVSYTISGTRLDVSGEPLGPSTSIDYVVGSDLAHVLVAAGVTAQAQP